MQDIFTHVYNLNDGMQATIYTDLTGRLLVRSYRGHQYIMVLINMDSSYISMEPMKHWHLYQMIKTYTILIDRLKACRTILKHHVLEN